MWCFDFEFWPWEMSLACWGRRDLWTCMGMRDIAFLRSTAFVCWCTIRIQRWQFLSKTSSRKKAVLFPDSFSLLVSTRTDDRVMTSCRRIKQPLLWCTYAPYSIHAISIVQYKLASSQLLTKTKLHHSIAANKIQKITLSESQSLFCLQIMWNPLLLCPPPYSQGTEPEQWLWTHRPSVCWIQCGWQIMLALTEAGRVCIAWGEIAYTIEKNPKLHCNIVRLTVRPSLGYILRSLRSMEQVVTWHTWL